MPRLVPLDATNGLTAMELPPGTSRFGRDEDNTITLPDPSISAHHGEFTIDAETVRVRDLGSTNGIWLEGRRVADEAVPFGTVLRIGQVDFVIEAASPAGMTAPAPRAPIRLGTSADPSGARPMITPAGAGTAAVPDSQGKPELACQKCGAAFSKAEVKNLQAGMRTVYGCPRCGGFCVPLAEHEALQRRDRATFVHRVADAFRYPFRGHGPVLLIGGTLFFGLLDGGLYLLGSLLGQTRIVPPMVLGGYLLLVVLSTGYLVACMQGILASSAGGDDQMPDWPEVSEFWSDILLPFLRFVAVVLVLLGPGFLTMFSPGPAVGVPLLLLGIFCAPMALLAVGIADSLGGLNPLLIFSGIAKVPGAYLLTWLVLGGLLLMAGVTRLILGLLPVPLLPGLASGALGLYALTVGMRLLGVMYHAHRERLNWL